MSEVVQTQENVINLDPMELKVFRTDTLIIEIPKCDLIGEDIFNKDDIDEM